MEVARLCLLDRDAKLAYDAWLRQRRDYQAVTNPSSGGDERVAARSRNLTQGFTIGPADESALTYGPVGFERTDRHGIDVTTFSSVASTKWGRRRKSKAAPIASIFLWLAGGAMGLLAGYAVLCMIDPRNDFLHVMFGKDQPQQAENKLGTSLPNSTEAPNRRIRSPAVANSENTRRIPQLGVSSGKAADVNQERVADRQNNSHPNRKPAAAPVGEAIKKAAPVIELTALEFPFDLKKRVLRVASQRNDLPSDKLLCNVHGSAELACVPLVDLRLGEKREVFFKVQMNDSIVGAEIAFLERNSLVVVEIRPKYRLPSGDEEAFYKLAGLRKAKLLLDQVIVATNARDSLPEMRRQLIRITNEYQAILPTANLPTTANRYQVTVAAQQRVAVLLQQGAAIEEQIRSAEALARNLSRLETDLAAIRQVGDWGAKIAQTATLAVCIHSDGAALDMEVK